MAASMERVDLRGAGYRADRRRVSYLHVQLLEPVLEEYSAAYAALSYVERGWHLLRAEPEIGGVQLSHVQKAIGNLEATYIIRLFSEFEAILIHHLMKRHPGLRVPRTAEALINRVALRERIADPIRELAQRAREYRNALVHRRIAPAPTQRIQVVMAALNRFLARLP